MITIKHNRATLTVKPENAQAVHDLLAKIDKSKGRKGRKLSASKAAKRSYPVFHWNMTTGDYVRQYTQLNTTLASVDYVHADRIAPTLDFSIPEVQCEALA